jgi:hypothetical protein
MVALHTCSNPDCGASVDSMHVEPYPIYKVVVGGDALAELATQLSYETGISLNLTDALYDSVSPIVFYARLSDQQAIELAQEENTEVTRARPDWSI